MYCKLHKYYWKIVNEFVNKVSKTAKVKSINIKNKFFTVRKNMPDIMNRYFCSVAETLQANILQRPNFLITGKYNINSNNKIFHFAKIIEKELLSACSRLETSFGSGSDNILSSSIKVAKPVLFRPL